MPKKSKLIIDTNIWISFLISKRLRKLDSLFNNDKITFVFCNELISEFVEVAAQGQSLKNISIGKMLKKFLMLFTIRLR